MRRCNRHWSHGSRDAAQLAVRCAKRRARNSKTRRTIARNASRRSRSRERSSKSSRSSATNHGVANGEATTDRGRLRPPRWLGRNAEEEIAATVADLEARFASRGDSRPDKEPIEESLRPDLAVSAFVDEGGGALDDKRTYDSKPPETILGGTGPDPGYHNTADPVAAATAVLARALTERVEAVSVEELTLAASWSHTQSDGRVLRSVVSPKASRFGHRRGGVEPRPVRTRATAPRGPRVRADGSVALLVSCGSAACAVLSRTQSARGLAGSEQ